MPREEAPAEQELPDDAQVPSFLREIPDQVHSSGNDSYHEVPSFLRDDFPREDSGFPRTETFDEYRARNPVQTFEEFMAERRSEHIPSVSRPPSYSHRTDSGNEDRYRIPNDREAEQRPDSMIHSPPKRRVRRLIAALTTGLILVKGGPALLERGDDQPVRATASSVLEDANLVQKISDRVETDYTKEDFEETYELAEQINGRGFARIARTLTNVSRFREAIKLSAADNSDNYDLEGARDAADEISDARLQDQAHRTIDRQIVVNAINETHGYDADIDEARDALEDIQSEHVKSRGERAVDASVAVEAISEAGNYGEGFEEAQDLLNGIQDDYVREIGKQGVELAGQYDVDHEAEERVDDRLEGIINGTEERFETLVARAEPDVLDAQIEASESLRSLITPELAAVNQIEAPIGPAFQNDIHDRQVINPQVGEGTRTAVVDHDEYGSEIEGEVFAEVLVENNQFVFERTSENSIDDRTYNQLNRLIENVRPFIQAGLESGNISSVIFTEGDYSPFYDTLTRTIVIQIPAYGEVSMNQLESGLLHETLHGLTRGANKGEDLSEENFNRFASVCQTLGENAYNNFEMQINDIASELDDLKQYLPADKEFVIDRLQEHIANGTLEDLIAIDNQYTEGNGLPYLCNTPGFTNLLSKIAALYGNVYSGVEFDPEALEDPDYNAVLDRWDIAIRDLSIYGLMNEGKFVRTSDPDVVTLGHSEDNSAELMATVANAAIIYGPEFIQLVRQINDHEEQTAIIEAMRVTFDMIKRSHPSLRGLMASYEAEIMQGIHGN